MKVLRFGLLGLGNFGKHYVRLLQELEGVKLIAVANTSKEVFHGIKNPLPQSVIKTTDPLQIINNREIDCVVIATPPSTHFSLAQKAINAGKNVLLEKPMVTNLGEAKELMSIVEKSNNTFMVGHQYLYNDHIRYLKKEIEGGSLGSIYTVIADHVYFGPIRYDVGCFLDAGTHILSLIHYLFNPEKIAKVSGNSVKFNKKGCDDFTQVTVNFENSLIVNMRTSWFIPEKVRKFTIVGEKGIGVFDDLAEKEKLKFFYRPYPQTTTSGTHSHFLTELSKIQPVVPVVIDHEPLRNELEHFIDCIRKRETPLTGIKDSYVIAEWIDTITTKVEK